MLNKTKETSFIDFSQQSFKRFLLVLLAYSCYITLFFPLSDGIRNQYTAFSIIPVAMTAWFFYIPGGLLGLFIMTLINGFLFSLQGFTPLPLFVDNIPGILSHLIAVLLIGYFRNFASRGKEKENKLEELRKKLEFTIEEKTDQINQINSDLEKKFADFIVREKEIKDTCDYLQKILDSTNAIIIGLEKNGLILYFNEAAKWATGWQPAEITGKSLFETLIHPMILTGAKEKFSQNDSLQNKPFESIIFCKDKSKKIILWQKNNIFQDAGIEHFFFTGIDITERSQLQEKIRSDEIKQSLIYQNSPHPALMLNGKFLITAWNDALLNLFGLRSIEPLRDKNFFEFIEFSKSKLDSLKNGEYRHSIDFKNFKFTNDMELQRSDIAQLLIDIRKSDSTSGDPSYILHIREITSEVKAENILLKKYDYLDSIYELSSKLNKTDDIMTVWEDVQDCIFKTLLTDRAAILLFDEDEVMRFKSTRFLSNKYMRLVEGHSPWKADTWLPTPVIIPNTHTGDSIESLRSIIISEGIGAIAFIPILYNTKLLGKLVLYYNFPHEFTENEIHIANSISNIIASGIAKKKSDEQLKKNQALFRTLLYSSRDEIRLLDMKGNIILDNHSNNSFSGYKENELLGKNIYEFIHPSDYLSVRDNFNNLLQSPNSTISIEFRFLMKRKIYKWIQCNITNRLDETSIKGILFSSHDIDAYRKISQSISNIMTMNVGILEDLPLLAVSTDCNFRISFVNNYFSEFTGYEKSEILGKDFFKFFLPESELESNLSVLTKLINNKVPFQHQTIIITITGAKRFINWSYSFTLNNEGAITAITAIGEDITETANL